MGGRPPSLPKKHKVKGICMCGCTSGQKTIELALRKLAKEMPGQALRAEVALGTLLDWTLDSPWKGVLWEFSRLTGDGFPLELGFSSSGNLISYTVEVAGPETDERRKLRLAEKKLQRLGGEGYTLPDSLRARFRELQKDGTLRYGCWIGGRHGPKEDRYKLYLEVPAGYSGNFVSSLLGEASLLPDEVPVLEMVGHEPLTGRTELYFSVRSETGLLPRELSYLLWRAGFSAQAKSYYGLIEEAHGDSLKRALSASSLGFSFACSAGGITGFSLFKFARSVCGGDGKTRKRLLELAGKYGWDLRGYATVSEALCSRNVWNTRHGMLGFGLAAGTGPFLQIGLRPPESFSPENSGPEENSYARKK
ncbi:hypothetical protein ACSAZK_00610 [Methanosarcina sp. Mfa9]|uniref:hypothetical protein n=1 Tax=Methanosarcina sp. Mfa9 TaxID=3439063 RepID=UPI003F833DD6